MFRHFPSETAERHALLTYALVTYVDVGYPRGMPKPHLRGWLHAGMTPLVIIAGLVLVLVAAPGPPRIAAAIFVASAALLFGTSALYHRGHWGPRAHAVLKRLDHSNIFVIIAGSYTPFAACLLPADQARTLLLVVWLGALGGVLFRVCWVHAPRWLYTPLYVAMGWVAVFYFGPFVHAGGAAVMALMATGGILYTLGAVVYGTRRPNPSPRWFGFHEVFHALTIAAFVTHYIAATLVVSHPVAL